MARGWHEGSIFRRADGRWVAMMSLEGGKRKSFYGKTRQEVIRKLSAAERDRARGLPVTSDRQTIEHYLTDWLIIQQTRLRPRTFVRYRDEVRLHILPTLGSLRLTALTAHHLEHLYAEKIAAGFSAGSVRHLHAILHKALADAERLEVIPRNVATLARAPRAQRTEMQYFTPAQARIFLQGIKDEPLEAFYVLALNTGMRRGEILALHWADVHLDATLPHLEVKYTLQDEQGGRFNFAPPKTCSGRRYVPLNQTVMTALRAHRARQEAQRQVAQSVSVWQEEDLVFTTAIGGPLRGNHILQRQFEPLCRRLGLPRIRLHDLRHTAATLMLANHQPTEFVSKVLGHSTPSITSDIYLHVTTPMAYEAVSSLDQLFVDVATAPPPSTVGDFSTAAHDGANPTGHANAHDLPPA